MTASELRLSLTADHDAGAAPWEAQEAGVANLARHSGHQWISSIAGRIQRVSFARAAQRLVTQCQLSRRGWAHQDTWDLNLILARRLGAQLTNLAETTNGWPGPEKYDSPQAWDRALRSAGTALTVYALDDRSIHRRNEAKDALHWVADNLEHLWW